MLGLKRAKTNSTFISTYIWTLGTYLDSIAIYTCTGSTVTFQALSKFGSFSGLCCLKKAKKGGSSTWASTISIVNEMLKLGRKDLVEALAEPITYDRKGDFYPEGVDPSTLKPWYLLRPLSYHKGFVQIAFNALYS